MNEFFDFVKWSFDNHSVLSFFALMFGFGAIKGLGMLGTRRTNITVKVKPQKQDD